MVRTAGETLQSIAQVMLGDASLWYQIADANGLTGAESLAFGAVIQVPNRVTNVHNNAGTFKPYRAGVLLGDTRPEVPNARPNLIYGPVNKQGLQHNIEVMKELNRVQLLDDDGKKSLQDMQSELKRIEDTERAQATKKSKKCGGFLSILVAVVAVVATIATAGALAGPTSAGLFTSGGLFSTGLTALGSNLGFAVAASVVGNLAGQVAANVLGLQKGISFGALAFSALSAGIGVGVNSLAKGVQFKNLFGNFSPVASAAVGNALTQGVGIALGQQERFSWGSLAFSAVTAHMKAKKVWEQPKSLPGKLAFNFSLSALQTVIVNDGKMQWAQVAANTLTQTFQEVAVEREAANKSLAKLSANAKRVDSRIANHDPLDEMNKFAPDDIYGANTLVDYIDPQIQRAAQRMGMSPEAYRQLMVAAQYDDYRYMPEGFEEETLWSVDSNLRWVESDRAWQAPYKTDAPPDWASPNLDAWTPTGMEQWRQADNISKGTYLTAFGKIPSYTGDVMPIIEQSEFRVTPEEFRATLARAAAYHDVPLALAASILQNENQPYATDFQKAGQFIERSLQTDLALLGTELGMRTFNRETFVGEVRDKLFNGSSGIANLKPATARQAINYVENTLHYPAVPVGIAERSTTPVPGVNWEHDMYYFGATLRQAIDLVTGTPAYTGPLSAEQFEYVASRYVGFRENVYTDYSQRAVQNVSDAISGQRPLYYYQSLPRK